MRTFLNFFRYWKIVGTSISQQKYLMKAINLIIWKKNLNNKSSQTNDKISKIQVIMHKVKPR